MRAHAAVKRHEHRICAGGTWLLYATLVARCYVSANSTLLDNTLAAGVRAAEGPRPSRT